LNSESFLAEIEMTDGSRHANEETRQVWNDNAGFWDERMGEGNDFVETLIWPATLRLLAPQPGEHILDIACGNGLSSRRLARLGVNVTAFDFAAEMIAMARKRTAAPGDSAQTPPIDYHMLDATDEAALLALGAGQFEAAICNMALFDMAEIKPLLHALGSLLRPGGRFVFSVLHPCFNSSRMAHTAEVDYANGDVTTTYAVKVSGYLTPTTEYAQAIFGQPRKQLVFHRPLHELLEAGFAAGFVLDGLEEPGFPPDHPAGKSPLRWGGNYSEIPPVLVARLASKS
jgi:2-polyprenyl-3-methyl-5-hydroxy-6-metoxy-1,4-benzoquinol methylase